MNALRTWALNALVLGLLALPAYAAEAQQDVPGPIDSLQDLQDTGRMLFKLADDNNDGLISQQEAIDVGNLMVGGYFFRADADGNGTVSRQEMQRARDTILAERPFLRVLVTRAKRSNARGGAARANAAAAPGAANTGTNNPMEGLISLLDSNNDNQIQSTELKQMVQTTIQSLYAAADTNRDNQLSPSEVNAAMAGAARSAAQAAFQEADTDHNNQLSQAEFDKALVGPANSVFQMLDANGDGEISLQESQALQQFLVNQARRLDIPEPANSPRNLLESGRTPREVAPVPNFNPNTGNRPAQPAAPARAPR